ncbi:putative membrane protein [Mycolicibacterium anyangense]|uniref:Putative membrane protein n=1 Tax=Mycolicibacterium anyangense TaxID=1431246 RepID=A0A6N4WDD9_9MYCO|nr:putative membrane protein [Mycolicibacterium anyangense]
MSTTISQRWRTGRWLAVGLILISAVAAVSAYLTAPRPGGRMDPESTSSDGAHAVVALLRQRGVQVIVAKDVADVERAARPDTLLLAAETYFTRGEGLLDRLAAVPGDRLLLEPTARVREAMAPGIRIGGASVFDDQPNCDLREANQAGVVQFGTTDAYEKAGDTDLTRCYGGALVRYRDAGRTITVVGSSDFMTNGALLKEGNAALAMNLAGQRPRLIWYAPQKAEGGAGGGSEIGDLVPDAVSWVIWQLCLVVVLLALWQGRRLGPLVAEKLPVVVRASETVEGRARLYRSRRARDQAAEALRTASLHRLTPRLGLGANASAAAIASAVAQRYRGDANAVAHILFGPVPATDADLLHLAHALDDIERQVTTT